MSNGWKHKGCGGSFAFNCSGSVDADEEGRMTIRKEIGAVVWVECEKCGFEIKVRGRGLPLIAELRNIGEFK
jgi:hypothetical protein